MAWLVRPESASRRPPAPFFSVLPRSLSRPSMVSPHTVTPNVHHASSHHLKRCIIIMQSQGRSRASSPTTHSFVKSHPGARCAFLNYVFCTCFVPFFVFTAISVFNALERASAVDTWISMPAVDCAKACGLQYHRKALCEASLPMSFCQRCALKMLESGFLCLRACGERRLCSTE